MSLGQVALGIASIVMGVHNLTNGARRLGQKRPKNGFAVAPSPVSVPGRPFMSSGYSLVRAPNGASIPMQMRSFEIRSLDDRIAYLRRLVDAGKRDPQIYAFARRAVTKRCGDKWCIDEKDNLSEAKAIFESVRRSRPSAELAAAKTLFRNIRKNVRYTSDILGVDTYQKPAHTLALKSGDCDDMSTLMCASLGAVGIPCRFKVIRTKGARDWNHIYPQAGFPRQNPKQWVSLDSSVDMPFGWEAPAKMVAESRVFRVG